MTTVHPFDFAADFANSASPALASSLLPAAIVIPQSSSVDLPEELTQDKLSTASVMTLSSLTSLPPQEILTDAARPTALTTSEASPNDDSNGLLLDSGLPSVTSHIKNSSNQTGTLTLSSYPTATALNGTASSSLVPENGANQPTYMAVAVVAAVLALI